jgi:geranylgeranyl diphosphate synthase, type II
VHIVFDLNSYLKERAALVEGWLATSVAAPNGSADARLYDAMRYSLLAGGKRLRPVLVLAACEAVGGRLESAMGLACAVEMIHTYSLIHDDLPCMDDDDLRRGQPTNHKVYGEGMAVLAGDALLTLAFECFLGRGVNGDFSRETLGRLAGRIASAAGSLGLVGGQVMDITGFSQDRRLETLETTCRLKTGRLIEVSLESGAIVAGADDSIVSAFSRYGRALGLAFQTTDDILNVTGDAKTMGKAVHSDASHHKVTFPELLGLDQARTHAHRQVEEAKQALSPMGESAWFLAELADHLLERQS